MITLRIPTTDPYAYLEVQFEGGAEEAIAEHRRLTQLVKGGEGLDSKEFNKLLDELIEKRVINGDPGIVESLNADQQMIFQSVKRSHARITNRNK